MGRYLNIFFTSFLTPYVPPLFYCKCLWPLTLTDQGERETRGLCAQDEFTFFLVSSPKTIVIQIQLGNLSPFVPRPVDTRVCYKGQRLILSRECHDGSFTTD